jgi:hypothetical protein
MLRHHIVENFMIVFYCKFSEAEKIARFLLDTGSVVDRGLPF